jgi:nitrous oxidase accessory protein NosD
VQENVILQGNVGVQLASSFNTLINGNVISKCQNGVGIFQPDEIFLSLPSWDTSSLHNTVSANNITDCAVGVQIYTANDNVFGANNFVNNSQNVYEKTTYFDRMQGKNVEITSTGNCWDRNFWSDYKGVDANGDGVGDTPYLAFNQITDHYPLMNVYPVLSLNNTEISSKPVAAQQPTDQPISNSETVIIAASVATIIVCAGVLF